MTRKAAKAKAMPEFEQAQKWGWVMGTGEAVGTSGQDGSERHPG